jgi:hypothetical protein
MTILQAPGPCANELLIVIKKAFTAWQLESHGGVLEGGEGRE